MKVLCWLGSCYNTDESVFQDIIYIEIKHNRWIKNSVSIVVLLQVQGQGLLHLVKLFNLFIVQCTIFLLFAAPHDLFALWKKLGCFQISISRLAKELFSLLNTVSFLVGLLHVFCHLPLIVIVVQHVWALGRSVCHGVEFFLLKCLAFLYMSSIGLPDWLEMSCVPP